MSTDNPHNKSFNLEEKFRLWRLDPVVAASEVFRDPNSPSRPLMLDHHQRWVLREWWYLQKSLAILGRGCGKCIAHDTLVWTDRGLVRIDSLGPRCPEEGDFEPVRIGVWGADGPETSAGFYNSGIRHGLEVRTELGYTVKGTPNHRVMCLRDGREVEVRLDEIAEGDQVVVATHVNLFAEPGTGFSEERAAAVARYDRDHGDRCTPGALSGDRKALAAYLRAYFEGHLGLWADAADATVAREVQVLLTGFGVRARRQRVNGRWRLTVTPDSEEAFRVHILKENRIPPKRTKTVDRVCLVEPTRGKFVDLYVPGRHWFCAGGFVQHNTFLGAVYCALQGLLHPGTQVGIIAPSYRQAQLTYNVIEDLYNCSPTFAAFVEHTSRRPEKCSFRFKSLGGVKPSVIEALPLGADGNKLRGARYFRIFIDEIAQVEDTIVNRVVRGFMATNQDPMGNVLRLKEAEARGQTDIELPENRIVFASSAYFQFNHLWSRVSDTMNEILDGHALARRKGQGVEKYKLIGEGINDNQIPHRIMSNGKAGIQAFKWDDPSPGFINIDSVQQARTEMSEYDWLMEYNAFFPADSDGVFKRSLLDKAREHNDFTCRDAPRPGCYYTMGIDPARGHDNFAVAIFEVEPEFERINLVRVMTWNEKPFPLMHKVVRDLVFKWKIEHFKIDGGSGGGGTTLRDMLADREMCPAEQPLILEQDNPEHRAFIGKYYLAPLCQFGNFAWLSSAVNNLLAGLQQGALRIAAKPDAVCTDTDATAYEQLEAWDDEMEQALMEWSSIIAVPTANRIRWDTPTKHQRKDRFSAILMGYDGALEILNRHRKPRSLPMGFWVP